MRLESLQVELRPRTPWEAVELGTALVRTHARAIWGPWLLVTLPVFAVLNAVGWALDRVWLASVALWWLKPVFDRIPLFVISRAVFGDPPGVRATLAAQWRWGWRRMLDYLTWRRLGPVRSLYLPIDLLEGGPRPAERRRVVASGARGVAGLLLLVCVNFEVVLIFGLYLLGVLFVPVELLSESMRAAWEMLSVEPPRWVQVLGNLVAWVAMSVVEPFYVGAGFGLYLDRRTRIEAWDVEIAFRRLRSRLAGAALAVLCGCAFGLALPARAASQPPAVAVMADGKAEGDAKRVERAPASLESVFGHVVADPGLAAAAERVRKDPLLAPSITRKRWVLRDPDETKARAPTDAGWLRTLAKVIGWVAEYGLWLLLAALVVLLLRAHATWLPWLRRMAGGSRMPDVPVTEEAQAAPESLPVDLLAAARAHWVEGRGREALALLYRGCVAAMVARTGAVLVPGATESECLRASRALADAADRDAFARVVRVWQYAAYAERLPADAEFEALLGQLGARFGWAA